MALFPLTQNYDSQLSCNFKNIHTLTDTPCIHTQIWPNTLRDFLLWKVPLKSLKRPQFSSSHEAVMHCSPFFRKKNCSAGSEQKYSHKHTVDEYSMGSSCFLRFSLVSAFRTAVMKTLILTGSFTTWAPERRVCADGLFMPESPEESSFSEEPDHVVDLPHVDAL